MDSRFEECIFIGYIEGLKGYILLKEGKKIILHSKNVVFDETLREVHNEERSFQSSGDVSKVEADEFTMQFQEKGVDSIVEDTTNSII